MKFIINTCFLFLFCLFGISSTAQETENLIIPLSKPNEIGFLEVDIKNGSIIVVGSDRKDIAVSYGNGEDYEDQDGLKEWTKSLGREIGRQVKIKLKNKGNMKDDNREGLRKIQNNTFKLEITEQFNHVNIENNKMGQQSMFVKIEVPKNMNIDVENYYGGNLYIKNISGEINLESYSGSIQAEEIGGIVSANTYSGDINIGFKESPKNGKMSFDNYSGDISISLPPNHKSNFKVKTDMGEILSDLDLKVIASNNKPKERMEGDVYKVYVDSWTFMELNGASENEIKIQTRTGDVLLRSNQ